VADVPRPALCLVLGNYAAEGAGGADFMLDLARMADEAGVDRLLAFDHVVFGENLQAYGDPKLGGMEGGTQPTGSDGVWFEPMTVLAVICGMTSRVRLATNILQAAIRRPVVLAKAAATLDVLSGGRLDLGVGVGWQREEYEAAGLEFENRGDLLNHTLEVCRTLWTEGSADYEDDWLKFQSIHCVPKPLQRGGIPIWVSGTLNPRVLDRIVRFGTGWIPWGRFASDPTEGVAEVYEALERAGRLPADFRVQGPISLVKGSDGQLDVERTMEVVPKLMEMGVTDFRIGLKPPTDPGEMLELLGRVVSAFRIAGGRAPE
jgi:probable F420-dependent oxidoreductase